MPGPAKSMRWLRIIRTRPRLFLCVLVGLVIMLVGLPTLQSGFELIARKAGAPDNVTVVIADLAS